MTSANASTTANGLTEDHIHSFVHLGTLGLSMLAHHSGMTAGFEDQIEARGEDEEEGQADERGPNRPTVAKPPTKPARPT